MRCLGLLPMYVNTKLFRRHWRKYRAIWRMHGSGVNEHTQLASDRARLYFVLFSVHEEFILQENRPLALGSL